MKPIRASKVKQSVIPFAATLVVILAVLLYLSVIRASLFGSVPEEKRVWFEITFLVLTAVLAELLVVHLRQPSVMILLLLGAVIAPPTISLLWPFISSAIQSLIPAFNASAPQLVSATGVIKIFAQLGAIILLFEIGLQSEAKAIFNSRNFVVALLGVLVPFIGGYYYALWTGHGFFYAVFLGAALTATSVGVTVAVLQEFKLLEKEFAKTILGAAVIDDVLALLVLSLVQNAPADFSAQALGPFASIIFIALVFIVGGILLGRWFVKHYFDKNREAEISTKTFLSIIAFMLFYAYAAEFIGLSAIVGAFIAGLTLNYSSIREKLSKSFFPLKAFFTPLFFLSLGMLVDLKSVWANAIPVLAITLIAIFTKIAGCGIGARLFGAKQKEALAVGFGMVPRGEIALIIALYGLTAIAPNGQAVLTAAEYSIISAMAFLTTIIVPVGLKRIIS